MLAKQVFWRLMLFYTHCCSYCDLQCSCFLLLPLIMVKATAKAGAHQMEPLSPIQALGVNPCPSRFIIRSVPIGDFARRQWEEPITTTKWQCYCTSSNSGKFGVDRPTIIISWWNVTLAFSSLRYFLSFLSSHDSLLCFVTPGPAI